MTSSTRTATSARNRAVAYWAATAIIAAELAVALVVPRAPRLLEWASAGAVFTYTGAAASHLAVGDGPGALGPSRAARILEPSK